jgi:hypothetical protein
VGEDEGVNPTHATPDSALAAAVDLARTAVLEVAPAAHVGDHVEATAEAELLLTHYFACLAPGYHGWRWAATVVRPPGHDVVTVAEVVLLPGSGALLAPAWLPWNERVRPGDLGPGDLFPTSPEDPRLEPGYTGLDALEAVDEADSDLAPLRPEQWELGLGRETVLSPYGRDLAAERWYEGDFGPSAPMAKAAPGNCRTCGFLLPLGGLVGQAFGVCANSFGADGRVIALEYGCGAHSSVREIEGTGVPVTEMVVDEYDNDPLELRGAVDEAAVSGLTAAAAELEELDVDELLADSVDDDEALFPIDAVESDDDVDDEHEDAVDASLLDDVDDIDDIDDEDDEDDEDDDEDEDDEDDEDDDAESVTVSGSELDDVVDIEPDEILG